jgi:hypothetical protein
VTSTKVVKHFWSVFLVGYAAMLVAVGWCILWVVALLGIYDLYGKGPGLGLTG